LLPEHVWPEGHEEPGPVALQSCDLPRPEQLSAHSELYVVEAKAPSVAVMQQTWLPVQSAPDAHLSVDPPMHEFADSQVAAAMTVVMQQVSLPWQ
jgi:hypothetical protein